jgi:arylsulfatase
VFVYLNGMSHLGNAAAAPVAGRSISISTRIARPFGDEDGVLLAHGSWNSGYALLVDEGRLVFDYNYYTHHHVLRSADPLPSDTSEVEVRLVLRPGTTAADVTMLVDGREQGAMALDATFENFVAFQGLDVGADRLSPVREHGSGAFPFEGEFDAIRIELLDGLVGRPHETLD